MKKLFLLGTALTLLPVAAFAESSRASVDVDLHASTLGFGLGLAMPVTENISGRLSFSKFNYAFQTTSGQTKYDAELQLGSVAALADWHLFSGITHLTAGLIYNNNEFVMTATPVNGSININGTPYTGTLNTNVTFNKVAPYLGLGWSGRASKTGLSFKSDFGVMFQGTPKSTLTATGAAAAATADIAAAQAQLDADMANFKLYPVVSVGLGYAF